MRCGRRLSGALPRGRLHRRHEPPYVSQADTPLPLFESASSLYARRGTKFAYSFSVISFRLPSNGRPIIPSRAKNPGPILLTMNQPFSVFPSNRDTKPYSAANGGAASGNSRLSDVEAMLLAVMRPVIRLRRLEQFVPSVAGFIADFA